MATMSRECGNLLKCAGRVVADGPCRRGASALGVLLVGLLVGACAPTASSDNGAALSGDGENSPAAAQEAPVEAISLLGVELRRPTLPATTRQRLEDDLARAEADFEADPTDEAAIIWRGRRLAYLGRYRDAIEAYTRGLETLPDSYRLRRHRGHRYITTRQFALAVSDLSIAAELASSHEDAVEPDGIPNARNIPLGTDRFNIWYHLGLAHYLRGDFDAALAAYRRCLEVSGNADLLVATTDWMVMTLRRLGRADEATALLEPITADLEIIENDAYYRRLLMYKGLLQPEELLDLRAAQDPDEALNIATQGYGVGNWYLTEGEPERARDVYERILAGTSWAAFGYIAAEADLARMREDL